MKTKIPDRFLLTVSVLGMVIALGTSAFADYDVQQKYLNTYEITMVQLGKLLPGKVTIEDTYSEEFSKVTISQWQDDDGNWWTALYFHEGEVPEGEDSWGCFNHAEDEVEVIFAAWFDSDGNAYDAGAPIASVAFFVPNGMGQYDVSVGVTNSWVSPHTELDPATIYISEASWTVVMQPYSLGDLNEDLLSSLTWYSIPDFEVDALTSVQVDLGTIPGTPVLPPAPPAWADDFTCYSWEDCGTLLGVYPQDGILFRNVTGPTVLSRHVLFHCVTSLNATSQQHSVRELFQFPAPGWGPPGAFDQLRYLELADNCESGTPQAYVAWIKGLASGDEVYASFWCYDTTPGASPSCRIWAHYTTSDDIDNYMGSAGGNVDYGLGTGWDLLDHLWVFDDDGGTRDALVIECRTYSNPGDVVWIDFICVDAPEHATVDYPEAGPSGTQSTTWGGIKRLFR